MRKKWLILAAVTIAAPTLFFAAWLLFHEWNSDYWRIQIGMSRDEVESILGPRASPAQWTNDGRFLGLQSTWVGDTGAIVVLYDRDSVVIGKNWVNRPLFDPGEPISDQVLRKLGLKGPLKVRE